MMKKPLIVSLSVLSLIGLIDAISYMAVAPSLVFYVTDLGGTKEQYGLIMSAFSFASFCFKPVYGRWVDSSGNKYKIPYLVSFSLAIFGNLMYFLAILLPAGKAAVYTLFLARFVSGLGAANVTLAYSYTATAIPHDQQTTTNILLSMVKIVGMSLGPFVNLSLSRIDTQIRFWNLLVPLNAYNSVGLMVAAGQLVVLFVTLVFLKEPPEKQNSPSGPAKKAGMKEFWEAFTCFQIMLPLVIVFVVNCNFQLIETAFPPASAHGLGWGPVQTSSVLGANALVMFFLMIFVMYLSVNKVSDTLLVVIGFVIWMTGGALMYYLWTYQAKVWQFVLPILFTISGFPFIAPSNRSIFTQAVKSKPELEDVQSMMQAIMSMGASVGGFVAPSLVAIFVIRSPDEVEASPDQRELTPAAIYVPISCALCIFGLLYEWLFLNHDEKGADTEVSTLSETTCLIAGKRRSSVLEIGQEFSRTNEVSRRQSVELMGVPCPFESNKEKCHRDKLWDDKQEWEEIHRLGALDEYE